MSGQEAGEQTGDSMGRRWKPVRPFILQAVRRRRLDLAFALLSTLLAAISAPGTNHNCWLSLTNLPPRKQKETQGLLATTLLPTEREALRAAVPRHSPSKAVFPLTGLLGTLVCPSAHRRGR